MQALLTAVLLSPLILSPQQAGQGVYQAKGAPQQRWSINQHHALIWNGAPYLPIGARIDGNPAAVKQAKEAGITDVIVNLPASSSGWKETIAALEAAQMRYLVNISSLAPMAKGYAIEPQAYQIAGIKSEQQIEARVPGALSAMVMLVLKQDLTVEKRWRIPVSTGNVSMKVSPLNDLDHLLLIYPEMRSLEQPDLWEALDEHRDNLLASLRSADLGPGFRGLVNPLGNLIQLVRNDLRFVPNSAYFHYEFSTHLKNKYRNVETAVRAWGMRSNDLGSFDRMARLVPLWSARRGREELWDPGNDSLYPCNAKNSNYWGDVQEVIVAAGARRYQRLVQALKSIADVPVIQDWAGWAPVYETTDCSLDGIGMRVSGGTLSQISDSAGRAASSLMRWNKPGWLLATSVDGAAGEQAAQLPSVIDDLTSLGARGWFVQAPSLEALKNVAALAAQRSQDTAPAQYSSPAVYFPEGAFNPAMIQRLSAGRWWLPSPQSGNRIDFGSQFHGYRIVDGDKTITAIWTTGFKGRVKLRMLDPKSATFESLDGTPAAPKLMKNGVEVSMSQMPLLVTGTNEVPVPESALLETADRFKRLTDVIEANRRMVLDEKFQFTQVMASIDRNPDGSFNQLRQIFGRVTTRHSRYTWIEAEGTSDHSFSEALPTLGCSRDAALSLRTRLSHVGQPYMATYKVPVRTEEDQEVWIAARIPANQRSLLSVEIGSQRLGIEGEPVSLYANGFGWYKLGITRMSGPDSKLIVKVEAPEGVDMAIDAIVLHPDRFRPMGVTLPDAINYPPVKQ